MDLLQPLRLGPVTAPNRVVFGPHETNLGDGRALSDRHVAYYARRARGGVGTIVVEEASVHPSDWPYERAPLAERCAEGWEAIAAACRAEGSVVLAALGHAGGQGSSAYSQRELWAPSRVPEVNSREVPKWMDPEDVDAVVDGFAAAAHLAVEAGCDGVEVNAGQHSIVRQFLSGLTNQRDDRWGQDRSAFAVAVLEAVRRAVGADRVVGLRLSCDELAPWAGLVPEAAAELAAALAAHVDSLTVVRGSIYSVAATRPDGHTAPGFNLDLSASVRAAVRAAHGDRVPVIAQGSIVDVAQAEWAVGEGARADGVEMTRALLADAALVAKAASGGAERIRPCILCNQTCQVRDARNPVVTCVVDPRTGHETTEPDEVGIAPEPRSVTVVGGGPAGLEAARVAASRGHSVVLYEGSEVLGGMVRSAARGAGWERLGRIVDWLGDECGRLGVKVHLGTAAPAIVTDGRPGEPEELILATGSLPGVRDYTVTRAGNVAPASEVLDDQAPRSGSVLVWDPIGGPIGVAVAERLAAGCTVHLVTPDHIAGNELSRSGDLAPANTRLQQAGVTLHRRSALRSVRKGSATIEHRFSGERSTLDVELVVDCGHRLPNDGLYEQVSAVRHGVVRAGDCVAPRTIAEAIREGRRAVLALEGRFTVSDGVPMGPRDR